MFHFLRKLFSKRKKVNKAAITKQRYWVGEMQYYDSSSGTWIWEYLLILTDDNGDEIKGPYDRLVSEIVSNTLSRSVHHEDTYQGDSVSKHYDLENFSTPKSDTWRDSFSSVSYDSSPHSSSGSSGGSSSSYSSSDYGSSSDSGSSSGGGCD